MIDLEQSFFVERFRGIFNKETKMNFASTVNVLNNNP